MAFNKKTAYGDSENILESEIGLVCKTRQGSASLATTEDGRKVIKAGTLFTETSGEKTVSVGVVFADYDVTDNPALPIAVVVQGRVKFDKVSTAAQAKKDDFAKQGLYLV